MIKGFYGGKFIPFHKGHKYCVERACQMCDEVFVILFDSPENRHLEHGTGIDEYLTIEARMNQLNIMANELSIKYPNVKIYVKYINTDCCLKEDGSEDWDKETPLVMDAIGSVFKYVYSSEPGYDEYFKRAYPFAEHILVDPPREVYPISATKIRDGGKELFERWKG